MIGRRLASGLHAVPVHRATLLRRTGRWARRWRLELECGHVLEDHETFHGVRVPTFAGCPHGCGADLGAIRREFRRKEAEAVAEERARWARRREAGLKPRGARARPA